MLRFFPRRYSTPELAMRKYALKHQLYDDDRGINNVHPISNKSCQTDILGLDKYLQRLQPSADTVASGQSSAMVRLQQQRTAYKKTPSRKPKVRSIGVHCERRRLTFSAFKGCQKFKHTYKRKISLPQPRSQSPTITIASDDNGRRNSGILPKLWPDRAAIETERSVAATKAAGPTVKLPRISMTRDAKLEPNRTDDGTGGGMRLARLTRPQSTGSGNSIDTAYRKLAYFRANSAPKIDSRYYTTLHIATTTTPTAAAQPVERELQSSTAGSSDTANTTLDMSYIVQHQLDSAENAAQIVTETESETTVTVTTTDAISSCTTRTVSTSTCGTFAAEPIFPIVFSCESVLRHPLDAGGYVSHTESHRFSVHYEPVEESGEAANDCSRSSSLVFTSSGGPCKNNERRLTGDSISVTPSTMATSLNTFGEKRLIIERTNTDVKFKNVVTSDISNETQLVEDNVQQQSLVIGEPLEEDYRFSTVVVDDNLMDDKTSKNIVIQNIEDYNSVSDKDHHDNVLIFQNENSVPVQKNMSDNTIIDYLGDGDSDGGNEGTELISHAHSTDIPLQQSNNEQNYERLTQNHQNIFDSDRTVTNQLPKFDDTEPQIKQHSYLIPETHATATHELELQSCSNLELTIDEIDRQHDVELRREQIDNNNHYSSEVLKVFGHPDEMSINETDNCSHENTDVMSSHQYSTQRGGGMTTRKPGAENSKYTNLHSENDQRSFEHNDCNELNVLNRLYDNISSQKRADDIQDIKENVTQNSYYTHSDNNMSNQKSLNSNRLVENVTTDRHRTLNKMAGAQNEEDNEYYGLFAERANESLLDNVDELDNMNDITECRKYDTRRYGTLDMTKPRQRIDSRHVRVEEKADTNTCHRCTHKNNETNAVTESKNYNYRNLYGSSCGKHPHEYSMSKHKLKSVDETKECTKQSNYIGGFLFGDTLYKSKQPEKYKTDHRGKNYVYHSDKYEYYDDPEKVNFSSKSNDRWYDYYQDYAPKNRHSPRDEDCTVFADVTLPRKSGGSNERGGVKPEPRYPSPTAAVQNSSYYSQLQADKVMSRGDDCSKNTDSDESLTDSLEDGCKFEGAAISYFLALDGQKSAVTFTLKMPNTLENRLNRRHSLLKKHLHVTTTVRKTVSTTRVRTRHKGCQTLWTEEKGVQVQRGSTATARKPTVDDHKVLETLLAGLERNRVSENQIRVVGGEKMVSTGNQTELQRLHVELPSNRHIQTTRDAAAGPKTPAKHAVSTTVVDGQEQHHKSHAVKKFSTDNALMVGVVRQNKYKGKEALDGAKNDQLLTLSKGWINFYTLRADSADTTDAQGNIIFFFFLHFPHVQFFRISI